MGSSKEKNTKDQRVYQRHFVELGSFAVFCDDNDIIPGQVADISTGGIAFFYYEGDEWPSNSIETFRLFGDDFYMENVSLEIVSDFKIVDEEHPIYKAMGFTAEGRKIRRRGVKFGELTDEQKEQLKNFIQSSVIVKI